MSHYLQYFNCEKMGRFPNGPEAFQTEQMGTFLIEIRADTTQHL